MRNSHEEEVRLANNMEEIKPAKQCSSIRCWSKIFYACFWLSLLNSALQGLMSLLKSALQGLNLPYCNLLHVQAFPVPPSGLSALLIIWFCSCSSFHFQVSRMKIARNAYARDPREDGKSIRHPVSRVVWTNNKVDELWFIQLLVGPSKHCRQHAGKAFSSFIQIFAVFSFRKWKCWCFLSGNARLGRTRVGRWRIQCWQSEMWTSLFYVTDLTMTCLGDRNRGIFHLLCRGWSALVCCCAAIIILNVISIISEQHQFWTESFNKMSPIDVELNSFNTNSKRLLLHQLHFPHAPTRLLLHLLPWTVFICFL